ncbi:MAG TPA: GNAT family N-acetyltransferase [Pyrinomonadaceae bacterium]|jgi:hypothetical protein
MKVRPYGPADKERWNEFVAQSKNGTFLFFRDYIDYHADRFADASLIISDEDDKIISLLPASREAETVISHAGLTYGGFLTDAQMTTPTMLKLFDAALGHLKDQGVSKLIYKTIPHIYHRHPAEEDIYALFVKNTLLYRRDVLSVIDQAARVKPQERRMRAARKALRNGLSVRESQDYEQFWRILEENLLLKYSLKPVHSPSEIMLLAGRFPNEIKLFASYKGEAMLAGAVLYLSGNVCHVQYNAASAEGKTSGALDILLSRLVEQFSESKRYFDFGVSTEKDGRYLNVGLIQYKEGFGARTVAHDFYELDIRAFAKVSSEARGSR